MSNIGSHTSSTLVQLQPLLPLLWYYARNIVREESMIQVSFGLTTIFKQILQYKNLYIFPMVTEGVRQRNERKWKKMKQTKEKRFNWESGITFKTTCQFSRPWQRYGLLKAKGLLTDSLHLLLFIHLFFGGRTEVSNYFFKTLIKSLHKVFLHTEIHF